MLWKSWKKGKGECVCVRERERERDGEKESEISEERGDIKYSCHTWRFWKCKKLFVQTFFLLCSVLENCFMSEKVCTKFPKALLLLYQFQIYCWIIFSFIVIYDILRYNKGKSFPNFSRVGNIWIIDRCTGAMTFN